MMQVLKWIILLGLSVIAGVVLGTSIGAMAAAMIA